jgi:hypothetical protein
VLLRAALVALCLTSSPLTFAQVVTDMTPERIAEAITAGEKGKFHDGRIVEKRSWALMGGVQVATFSTPFMRVAAAAAHAKRNYQALRPDDVTNDLTAPELHIYAWAQGDLPHVHNVVSVVITPRKGSKEEKRARAIHPKELIDIPTNFRNAFGASADASGKMAVFPLDALNEQHEVHVIYDNTETIKRTNAYTLGCIDCSAAFNLKGVR